MDWESKFSSIVKETESNLAKVKHRLGSARTSSQVALSLNSAPPAGFGNSMPTDKRLTSYSSFNQGHLSFNYSGPSSNILASSTKARLSSSADAIHSYTPAINGPLYGGTGDTLPLEHSPGVISLLAEKLETQGQTIEHLTRTVKKLEDEREQYYRQTKDLREELALINSRISEKGVDLHTERKIEQWRRDMMAEMSMLSSQLQIQRSKEDDGSFHNNNTVTLIRDMQETKRFMQEDCDMIRRELEGVKTKMVKLELEFASLVSDNRDLSRRHDKLEKSVRDVLYQQGSNARDLSRAKDDRGQDKMEITELRSSLRGLRDKIGHLESKIHDSATNTKDKKGRKNSVRRSRQRRPAADLFSPDTTDLDLEASETTDLADLHSSDFSFSPKNKPKKSAESADELSLDDLDLTTDDLLSSFIDTEELK